MTRKEFESLKVGDFIKFLHIDESYSYHMVLKNDFGNYIITNLKENQWWAFEIADAVLDYWFHMDEEDKIECL